MVVPAAGTGASPRSPSALCREELPHPPGAKSSPIAAETTASVVRLRFKRCRVRQLPLLSEAEEESFAGLRPSPAFSSSFSSSWLPRPGARPFEASYNPAAALLSTCDQAHEVRGCRGTCARDSAGPISARNSSAGVNLTSRQCSELNEFVI
jgi:hypothetical protein|eukprot:COSAG01_NODE_10218_length_2218_cov_797.552147_2_plen_152_part_00